MEAIWQRQWEPRSPAERQVSTVSIRPGSGPASGVAWTDYLTSLNSCVRIYNDAYLEELLSGHSNMSGTLLSTQCRDDQAASSPGWQAPGVNKEEDLEVRLD